MTNQSQIRILSVEGNSDSRTALRVSLSKVPDFVLTETKAEADILHAIKRHGIDLVILSFPGLDAVGLTRQIRQHAPTVRVLVFTGSDSPEHIFQALDAGADAYVLKTNLTRVLEMAVRSVRLGAVWLDPGIAQQVLQVMEAPPAEPSRILPTGFLRMPLMPHEKSVLDEVASSNCVDGVCMVDPAFVRKLKRFSA